MKPLPSPERDAHAELEFHRQRVRALEAELGAAPSSGYRRPREVRPNEEALPGTDQLLAAVSQELRTPLNVVLASCEALGEGIYGALTPPQARAVHRVEEGGRRLLALVESLVDFTSLAAGRAPLERCRARLGDLCTACITAVRAVADKKGVLVQLDVTDDFVILECDAVRVMQAIGSLLANAVKLTPEQGTVGLAARVDEAQASVRFTVWGSAIGPERRDLGQPIAPLDAGLGLAVARQLVHLHGGTLAVEREPGRGPRFIVDLPLTPR